LEEPESLRVLVAGAAPERRMTVVHTVAKLGHAVVTVEADLPDVVSVTRTELPDVAIVIVGEASNPALTAIDRIVKEAECPVIALLDVSDRTFTDEASRLGIFAFITERDDPSELRAAIDVALHRFSEYHALEGAFRRRAVTERAKGVLMERHGVSEQEAFNMLRARARSTSRKVVDVAEAVVTSHALLPRDAPE
jgi:two-component system, response regulator PdtaR